MRCYRLYNFYPDLHETTNFVLTTNCVLSLREQVVT